VGCTTVDWGGIGTQYPPREDDPGFGLYHFKRGFNARLAHLTAYHDMVFSPRVYTGFRLLERRVAAPAWTARARLNRGVEPVARMGDSVRRKSRQFGVSLRQRGVVQTLYWGAFGFLRPNRFHVLARDLSDDHRRGARPEVLSAKVWDARAVQAYRRTRSRLPPEFYQDEIDGVEMCSVVLEGRTVAGLIWIYRIEDASRLFHLRETEAELNNGFVLPEFRGRGIFKISIAAACDWLRDQDCQVVYAMVHTDNHPSKAAFEGEGFRPVATVRHFLLHRPAYRGPSRQEPA
jgi:RimJ/RimL family protein N-acetyltransferase